MRLETRLFINVLTVLLVFTPFNVPMRAQADASSTVIMVPQDYPTIREAIDAANAGDTIRVASGTYYESFLTINKGITLVGENLESTIIDGTIIPDEWYGHMFLLQNASDVTISNLTIQNAGYGIFLNYSSNCIVRANRFGGEFNRVTHPLLLDHSDNNMIEDNSIDNGFFGVYMTYSSGNVISGNFIRGSSYYGVYMQFWSNYNIVCNNTISWNPAGIGVYYLSAYNTIKHNTLTSNWESGLHLLGGMDNLIIRNEVVHNRLGMALYGAERNVIHHNNFINNTYQIDLDYAVNNTFDNGEGVGNFWNDYKGQDTNGDMIGDTLVPHLGVDSYPLMKAWKPMAGDLNEDGLIDITDLALVATAFGSQPSDPRWCQDADLNADDIIDIFDLVAVTINFGGTI